MIPTASPPAGPTPRSPAADNTSIGLGRAFVQANVAGRAAGAREADGVAGRELGRHAAGSSRGGD